MEKVTNFFADIIGKMLIYFANLDVLMQAGILLVASIFILIGLFTFIKKGFKVIVVLALLAAVGYILYDKGVIQPVIDKILSFIGK